MYVALPIKKIKYNNYLKKNKDELFRKLKTKTKKIKELANLNKYITLSCLLYSTVSVSIELYIVN